MEITPEQYNVNIIVRRNPNIGVTALNIKPWQDWFKLYGGKIIPGHRPSRRFWGNKVFLGGKPYEDFWTIWRKHFWRHDTGDLYLRINDECVIATPISIIKNRLNAI